jgi:hypothetical protein
MAASIGSPWYALLVTLYVASSVHLTHASQQIKWTAVAPLLSLAAASLLLTAVARERWWGRIGYVLCIAGLLHVHYFCVWVLAGHLLYVLVAERSRLRVQLIDSAVAVALVIPWYAFALPSQLEYVGDHFARVSNRAVDAWNAPIGLTVAIRAVGYDALVGLGLLPLPIRARFLAPLLALAGFLLLLALRSPAQAGRRRLACLAICSFLTAVAGQTAYAVRVGNVVPLQPLYLSPWFPLLMVAVISGATEFRTRSLRVLFAGVLVGASLSALLLTPLAEVLVEADTPRRYSDVCQEILAAVDSSTGVVFRSEMEAKLVNITCPITSLQAIGWRGAEGFPAHVVRAVLVSPCWPSGDVGRPAWRAANRCVEGSWVLIHDRLELLRTGCESTEFPMQKGLGECENGSGGV